MLVYDHQEKYENTKRRVEMLRIEHLTKSYDEKKAVDDLSLHIKAGEIFGFIGHNGAGKSTTLKSAVGILKYDEGKIYINGASIKDDPLMCKKELAYIPDNPDMYDFMSGIKYLNFIADVFDIDAAEREADIKKYADMFEITDSLGDLISSYSHGMKQKVAIISALIHSPRLLVLDEPFVGLDPKASFILKEIMREMCARGTAIFFSTHVLDTAEKLCNKIAIIRQGKIIAAGTMEELTGGQSLEEVFLEAVNEQNHSAS